MADGGVWTKIYPDVASLGGGKVLQVVHAKAATNATQVEKTTTPTPVNGMSLTVSNIQPGSNIYLFAGLLLQSQSNGNAWNRSFCRIVNGDGGAMPGCSAGRLGDTNYSFNGTPTCDQYMTLLAHDLNPGTSQSYQVEMWSNADNIAVSHLAGANHPIFYAMEVDEA